MSISRSFPDDQVCITILIIASELLFVVPAKHQFHLQMSNQEYYLEHDDVSTEDVQGGNESTAVIVTSTMEKETNTECNFRPEGVKRRVAPMSTVDDRLSIKRSQTFSPTPQLAKNQYICR